MNLQLRSMMCVLALSILGGCALVADRRQEIVVYSPRLHGQPTERSVGSNRPWQLVIALPEATNPLDTGRIVVMPKPGEIQFYGSARWRDATPAMLQALLLEAHEDQVDVARPGSGVHADFVLRTQLKDFQAEYRGARIPTVVIGVTAQVVAGSSGRVVAKRVFTIEQSAAGTGMAEVFAAFDSATNRLLAELVEWSLATGDAAWLKVPAANSRSP